MATAKKATAKKAKVQKYEYQAELKQLLKLIVHSLYTHPEVFLRELISNSSDAMNKVRFQMLTDSDVLDADKELQIKIHVDEEKQTFSIADNGIGMTEEDLISRIGTVASSGTLDFIEQLKKSDEKFEPDMIGQFGVGFYSIFMVTDEVIVETRHANKDSKGYRWRSDGQGSYTIEEIEKATRGTTISFRLSDEYKEFSQKTRLQHIINKYSNFVDFPILLNDERANKVEALWHRNKSDLKEDELNEFYKFISTDYANPAGHIHLSIEGAVNFKALLFIPETAPNMHQRLDEEKSLQLYSRKVFIQDDCKELLPEYLRFVKGVVDTEDLPLNVSREVTQNSPAMAKIKNILTGKILSYLEDMAKNEAEKFEKFYQKFGQFLKFGINTDFDKRDRLIKMMRFTTTKSDQDKTTTFSEYVERMGETQNEIYYISGETRGLIERNPNLEYFKKHDIEVLLLTDPADIFIVPGLNEFEKKPIKSIDNAELDIKSDEKSEDSLSENLSTSLISVFKETLSDKVEDVIESKRLVDSPATLVVGKEGMDPQMEKMMKMLQQEFTGSKRILEINTSHPLIKNLSRLNMGSSTDPLLRDAIVQIYEGASLIEGTLKDPTDFIKRMTEILTKATSA